MKERIEGLGYVKFYYVMICLRFNVKNNKRNYENIKNDQTESHGPSTHLEKYNSSPTLLPRFLDPYKPEDWILKTEIIFLINIQKTKNKKYKIVK